MKKGYTHISVVIDRSGSMSSIKADTIGGFNTFLQSQKEAPGTATMSFTQFDDRIELVHSFVDIQRMAELTDKTFVPRGSTALLDAVGLTIVGCGEKLAALEESERPEKVIFVILTDGYENASREYTYERITEMIKHQTEKYQWEFVFLGANIDAQKIGSQMGIKLGNSMTFAANTAGVEASYGAISKGMTQLRSMSKFDYDAFACSASASLFTEEDREQQKQAGA